MVVHLRLALAEPHGSRDHVKEQGAVVLERVKLCPEVKLQQLVGCYRLWSRLLEGFGKPGRLLHRPG